MTRRLPLLLFCLTTLASTATLRAAEPETTTWDWQRLPDLPNPLGVAGAFAGESNGALIVAGGSNFPKAPPWRGGQKVCYAAIHLLLADHWVTSPTSLPHPLSYGVSIPTDHGLILVGGCDTTQCYPDVYRLRWSADNRIHIETLPPLPHPLAYMTGAVAGDTLFIAGGQESISNPRATSRFYTLDLSQEGTPHFTWHERPAWPGPARIVPASCALGKGPDAAFYLFSGRDAQPGHPPQPLTDAYCYHPATDQWEPLPPPPHCVMAASALASGPHTLLILGGDDGKIFTTLEQLRRQIADAPDADTKDRLTAQLNQMLDDHPGFSRDILQYDAVTRRYTPAGTLPRPAPVTTPCVPWHGGILLPAGEVRPGIRSPAVWLGRPTHAK